MAAASSSSADNAGAIIFIKGDDGNIYIDWTRNKIHIR